VAAYCNGVSTALTKNVSYFKLATACTTDLSIKNLDTSEVLYTTTTLPTAATILTMIRLNRFFYPTIRLIRSKSLTAESVLHAEVYVYDTVNKTYDTANNWCVTNATNATMLVCTLGKQIALSSQINFKLWLVANNVTIDTFIGTPIITLTDTSIVTLKYEFKTYYFAIFD